MTIFEIIIFKLTELLEHSGIFFNYMCAKDEEPYWYNEIKGYRMVRSFSLEKNTIPNSTTIYCLYLGRHRFTWYKSIIQVHS